MDIKKQKQAFSLLIGMCTCLENALAVWRNRSHGKGIFYKEPVTGAALGNKSVFWIEPDCFIVNIVFAWEQAIGKTTQSEVGMI